MPEQEPIPLNLTAAETILGTPSTDVHDGELGEGIEFTVKEKTLRIFPGALQLTVRTGDIAPEYGPGWVGVRGTADGMPLVFALSHRGEVVLNNRAPRPADQQEQTASSQADAEATQTPGSDTDARLRAVEPEWTPPDREFDTGEEVHFTGKIGDEPHLVTGRAKRWYLLPVIEHSQGKNGEDTETHHLVFTSDRLTRRIRENKSDFPYLKTGQEISVDGYRHEPDPNAKGPKAPRPYVLAWRVSSAGEPRPSGRGGARRRSKTTP